MGDKGSSRGGRRRRQKERAATQSSSRWMSSIATHHVTRQSGLPVQLFTFYSKLIRSVRMMTCVVRLSPLAAIQWRACVSASIFIVKQVDLIECSTAFPDGGRALLYSSKHESDLILQYCKSENYYLRWLFCVYLIISLQVRWRRCMLYPSNVRPKAMSE